IVHLGIPPVYRDGRLWVFEPRDRDALDSTSVLYWMELDVRGWPNDIRVVQSGTYSEPGVSIYGAAAALDASGNLVIVYTRSGPSDYLSVYYTGRLASDPLGSLRTGHILRSGSRRFVWVSGTQNERSQFIDYPTAVVDPVDASVWITGLVPSPNQPIAGRSEESDALIG